MRTDVNGINVARLMELFAVDGTEEPSSTSSKVLAINIVFSISFRRIFVKLHQDNIATDGIFFYFLNERHIDIFLIRLIASDNFFEPSIFALIGYIRIIPCDEMLKQGTRQMRGKRNIIVHRVYSPLTRIMREVSADWSTPTLYIHGSSIFHLLLCG